MVAFIDSRSRQDLDLPLICVVTVCRNALPALEFTVAAVWRQTWSNLHYLVVDGASTDGTRTFLEAMDVVVSDWISEPDNGIYDAMNKAIARCPDNSWVVFMNAGDCFAADDVLLRLAPMLNDETDMLFGGVAVASTDGRNARRYPAVPVGGMRMPGCHQSLLVRASWLKQYRFDTRYRVGADFEFYLRSLRAGARIALFDDIIARVAPEGYSAANEDILQHDYCKAITVHSGWFGTLLWLAKRKFRRLALRVLGRA